MVVRVGKFKRTLSVDDHTVNKFNGEHGGVDFPDHGRVHYKAINKVGSARLFAKLLKDSYAGSAWDCWCVGGELLGLSNNTNYKLTPEDRYLVGWYCLHPDGKSAQEDCETFVAMMASAGYNYSHSRK